MASRSTPKISPAWYFVKYSRELFMIYFEGLDRHDISVGAPYPRGRAPGGQAGTWLGSSLGAYLHSQPERLHVPNRMMRDQARFSRQLASLSHPAERLFWRLILVADDYGRFRGEPVAVLTAAYPVSADRYRVADCAAWLAELVKAGLVQTYSENGHHYAWMIAWATHQRVRAARSKYPKPPDSPDMKTEYNQPHKTGPDRNLPQVAASGGDPRPRVGSRESRDASRESRVDQEEGSGGKPLGPRYSEEFNAWYSGYPRKLGKGHAWKYWRKIGAEKSQALRDKIQKSTTAHKTSPDWTRENGRFIPKPSKFLIERRFDDSPKLDKGIAGGKIATWKAPEDRPDPTKEPLEVLGNFDDV